ncbi:hypothetical protein FHK92_21010 [Pseudomonas brassicacearum subsp. neoaurantiaca]|uniref:PAAR domain-containing protein n=1 Tax=Pseudomonas brassicacearum subsp. neoaurantiaca TaxID=494916 RepID=A0A7V8ZUL8_9PSED|nr:hypothetical protein [Pseudomonas brassicacearum subsp. neoaurantiaca]
MDCPAGNEPRHRHLIVEGSATVLINGKPAARLHSKMVCGAHIKSGSPNRSRNVRRTIREGL